MTLRSLLPWLVLGTAAMFVARGVRGRIATEPAPPRDATAAAVPPRSRRRLALAGARLAAFLAFLIVWALLLRPQALGGPAIWVLVSGNSMQPSLHDGDLVLAKRRSHYHRGDVIAYRIPRGDVGAGSVVIHRIAGGHGREGFITRGDNRARPDVWRPTDRDVAGRLVATVPAAGDVLRLLQTPIVLASLAALTAFLSVPRRRQVR